MSKDYDTITVILKGYEDSPLVYKNASLNIFDDFERVICIKCKVKLPVNEDKTEYKDYELIEHIPYCNVLRYYALNEEE